MDYDPTSFVNAFSFWFLLFFFSYYRPLNLITDKKTTSLNLTMYNVNFFFTQLSKLNHTKRIRRLGENSLTPHLGKNLFSYSHLEENPFYFCSPSRKELVRLWFQRELTVSLFPIPAQICQLPKNCFFYVRGDRLKLLT